MARLMPYRETDSDSDKTLRYAAAGVLRRETRQGQTRCAFPHIT